MVHIPNYKFNLNKILVLRDMSRTLLRLLEGGTYFKGLKKMHFYFIL